MDMFRDSSGLVDVEDNAFYEELTRQILMLMDEDDETRTYAKGAVELQQRPTVYYGGYGLVGSVPVDGNYFSWSESGRSSVPAWMEGLWANGGAGTGVFIPRGVTAAAGNKSGRRRHNSKARKNNDRGRMSSAVGQKVHG